VDPFPLKYPRKGRIRNKAYRILNVGVCSGRELHYSDLTPQSTYICRVHIQLFLASSKMLTPPAPTPPLPAPGIEVGGGVIILEDERHRIDLLQYNLSTFDPVPRPSVYDPAEMTGQISRSHLAVYSAPPETPEIGRIYG
jgi:hypothetical protein